MILDCKDSQLFEKAAGNEKRYPAHILHMSNDRTKKRNYTRIVNELITRFIIESE